MNVEDLVRIREIEQLKYRYMRAVDTRDWDLLASTLAPDVIAEYGDRLSFESRDDLVRVLSKAMDDSTISLHHLHQPEITLDGDTASGVWALHDRVIRKREKVIIDGASIYHDEYRRGADGEWLITRTGYERIYESVHSMDDLPSFTFTADRFAAAPAGRS